MRHFEVEIKPVFDLAENMQQRHRIRPAGDRDENAIAR
jgi:hypothetical protein